MANTKKNRAAEHPALAAIRDWEWRQWLDAVTDWEMKRQLEII
jgi:hypothetical protein